MIKINNDYLSVDINPFGGEKKSITELKTNRNFLWNSDPVAWKNCAIPLFPIVGRLVDDSYTHQGKVYHLTSHGLARHYEFDVKELTDTRCVLSFLSSEETLTKYPFDFEFIVSYELEGHTLKTSYEVINTGDTEMLFTVGGHPAFKVPLNDGERVEDYYIEFNQKESKGSFLVVPDDFDLIDSKRIELKQATFSNDAIIFENLNSSELSIINTVAQNRITVNFEGFPYLAIWASNNWNHLIAIEPWYSHGDFTPGIKELKDIPGMMNLAPNAMFECHYSITIES